jgi:hypothetical protein
VFSGTNDPPTICLTLSVTNLVNVPTLAWQPTPNVEGSGSGSLMSSGLYSGPAWFLSSIGLTNGIAFVQCSNDLLNWTNFPPGGAILTLLPTNSSAIILPQPDDLVLPSSQRFFRVQWFSSL